ncbi:hypothetical protein [Hymenobacter metallicola]|uniref:Uncharacterized protein n=1 Tax=Hymenobacter metallicola TaxID=2563114 RepID=A0A4Z0PZY1_9BACT|nr:hypothetical protein [Hymenobacter metallicola]TGE22796.1 hypothetical protein E5K02_20745 [Hymenobacter metallicola]
MKLHYTTPAPTSELPATSTGKPCIRDYSELVTKIVPEPVAQLVPLPELRRRLSEVVRKDKRYAEEAPIYLQNETNRRAAFDGAHLR